MAGTILIVDDDAQVVRHLEYLLRAEGYQVAGAHSAVEVRNTIRVFFPDVVLLDLKLPDADGLTLMKEIRETHPSALYLIMTAYGSIKSAVEATRLGATDYMTKPVDVDELLISVRNALRERVRDEEVRLLRQADRRPHTSLPTKPLSEHAEVDYPSEAMRSTLQKARQAAAGDSVVLLLGESFAGMRRQDIPRLVEEAIEMVKGSQVVDLEHSRAFSNYFAFFWPQILDNEVLQKINGASIRLYLWLLVEQEERARKNEFTMKFIDAEIARALGASRQTIGRYRGELEKLGLLKVKRGIWTVGYTPKSQWNT